MVLERKPKEPLKVTPGYKPEGYEEYRVEDGDGWVKIAKRFGIDVWALIEANFKTRNPREVNWYLRHYVGCDKRTPDGKNLMFSSSAGKNMKKISDWPPGRIFIPATTIRLPPIDLTPVVRITRRVWEKSFSHPGDSSFSDGSAGAWLGGIIVDQLAKHPFEKVSERRTEKLPTYLQIVEVHEAEEVRFFHDTPGDRSYTKRLEMTWKWGPPGPNIHVKWKRVVIGVHGNVSPSSGTTVYKREEAKGLIANPDEEIRSPL